MRACAEGLNKDDGDNPNPEASVGGQGRDDKSYCGCVSEQGYVDSGNETKVLFLMCIGVMYRNNNNEEQPLSLLPKNSQVCPKNLEYILEVTGVPIRLTLSQYLVQVTGQGFKYWSGSTTIWLEMLRTSIFWQWRIEALRSSYQVKVPTSKVLTVGLQPSGGQGGWRNWRGIVPYLCVIMSLTQNNVKCLFLARANTKKLQVGLTCCHGTHDIKDLFHTERYYLLEDSTLQ